MDKPACLCEGKMTFLMDNKRSAIWECENCGRLLLNPYHADGQRWYFPQTGSNESGVGQAEQIAGAQLRRSLR
ncbi:MAG: hypothetical protein Q8O55_06735 [Dehalococcoidales bacterium]|nr:hypothetical protein [Dehalococcoidales bacterium]